MVNNFTNINKTNYYLSTKQTTTSHFKSLNTKMTTTHVNGNPGPGLYDRHKMVAGLISSWYLSPPHLDVWISNSHTDNYK